MPALISPLHHGISVTVIGGGGPVPSMMRVHLSSPHTTHPTLRKSDANPSSFTRDRHRLWPSTVARRYESGEATPMNHPMPHNLLHPHLPLLGCPEPSPCRMATESDAVHATHTRPWQTHQDEPWHPSRGIDSLLHRCQGIHPRPPPTYHSKSRDIKGSE